MAFELSYAGVGLCIPTQESLAWADENISPDDLRDVAPPPRRPGKNLRGLAWDEPAELQPTRIGEFHWPAGATRWACGRFLVTGAKAFEILTKVIPGGPGGGYKGANLILQSDGGLPADLGDTPPSITAKMYALPPRPLAGLVLDPAQTDAAKDLYLLTLVDVRYFWQWATVTAKGGAWDELVAACAAGLDVDLDAGTIDPVYGRAAPDSGLWVNEENAALVLDAALWNTGRVLAANYDGTFTIQKVIDCREAVKRERKFWRDVRTAGGPVLNLDAAIGDEWRKALLPQTVRVTFPKVVEDEDYVRPADDYRAWHVDSYGSVHSAEIDLTTLDGYKQHVGTTLTWSKTFHDTAFALYPTFDALGDPDNQHDLWCLAIRVAKDYADGLLARLDEVYPGVLPWAPDGVNDVVVTYRTDDARTRIRGRPFNAGVTEFQHCLPFAGGESGSGSGSGCSGPVGDDCPRTNRSGSGAADLHRLRADGFSVEMFPGGVLVYRVRALKPKLIDGDEYEIDDTIDGPMYAFLPGGWVAANGDEFFGRRLPGGIWEAVARIECVLTEDTGGSGSGATAPTCCFECFSDFIEAKFDPDTDGVVYRRRRFHWPYKVRTCVGEWQLDFPPPDF